MSEEQIKRQWEGKVQAEIQAMSADQVWSIVKNFCNLHQLFPLITECYCVEGTEGTVGCLRRCASPHVPPVNGDAIGFAFERLVLVDNEKMLFSYEILDNNVGFECNSTFSMKVVPELNPVGCRLEWSFVVDPMEGGWTLDKFISFLEPNLKEIAKGVEGAAKGGSEI